MTDTPQRAPEVRSEDVSRYLDAAAEVVEAWEKGAASGPIFIEVENLLPIKIKTIHGDYQCIHEYRGGINAIWKIDPRRQSPIICIALPVTGLPCVNGAEFCRKHRTYIAGACVHEYVHWLQKKKWPNEYDAYAKQQREWRGSHVQQCPSADELNRIYYGNEFEIAAHAAQAAVEIAQSGIDLYDTEVLKHIGIRLRGDELAEDIQVPLENVVKHYRSAFADPNNV